AYRYKTRPWEMNHIGTTCTHCADGCKTTLGVRRSETGMEIVRGDNRDKSGINGDFLCIKGRYAFDFANRQDRLTQPLIRKDGQLAPSTWEEAFELIGKRFKEARQQHGGQAIGVVGSNRTTNEENYLLQKFARVVLQTNNIDHHRTADFPGLAAALKDRPGSTASMRDVFDAPAILLIGNDPTEQHPLLAWQIRNNVRLHNARLYVLNAAPIKLQRQAVSFTQISADAYGDVAAFLADGRERSSLPQDLTAIREKLRTEQNLVIIFGSEVTGEGVTALAKFAAMVPGAKIVCLADYANSRGAADMGLYPDLLPGYAPANTAGNFHQEWAIAPPAAGLTLPQMFDAAKAGNLRALYVVGANPVGRLDID